MASRISHDSFELYSAEKTILTEDVAEQRPAWITKTQRLAWITKAIHKLSVWRPLWPSLSGPRIVFNKEPFVVWRKRFYFDWDICDISRYIPDVTTEGFIDHGVW